MGFWRRKVHALKGISFNVKEGEVFGIVGPNGAGKTTTIKIITGLTRSTSGSALIYGINSRHVDSRKNLGYLPEGPYFYEHLNVEELLTYYGMLHGLSRATIRVRAQHLIEKVGLAHATNKPLRNFSKGMRQRAGLAQALINDPSLVILDEPQSGLDPMGRRDVRNLIFDLKEQGKTVIFSSHILPDVEAVCDRVALFHKGKILQQGELHEIMSQRTTKIELLVSNIDEKQAKTLPNILSIERKSSSLYLKFSKTIALHDIALEIHNKGGTLHSVTPIRENLEEVFIRQTDQHRQNLNEEE